MRNLKSLTSSAAASSGWMITANVIAFGFLLLVSTAFGVYGKRIEMAEIIVAASLALAFLNLDKFESFKGAGFAAILRKVEGKVEGLFAKSAEVGAIRTEATATLTVEKKENKPLVGNVLLALASTSYAWRSLAGIARDTKLGKREVRSILNDLVHRGLVIETLGNEGKKLFALTLRGRATAQEEKDAQTD